MIVTNAERLEDVLCRVFTGEEDADALLDEVREVRTFADSGLLTRDRGIVLRLAQGQEFQVTIVLSERARVSSSASSAVRSSRTSRNLPRT